jgi:putative hydrolase of the HAD superfamily
MKNSAIKNIVFDLGGVLLEWNIDKIVSACFDSPELREKAKTEVFKHPDWHSLDEGTMKEEEAMERYQERTGFPMEEIHRIVKIARESLVPMPESHKLMDDLRDQGYDLYCLSNMHEVSWELITRRFDFWGKFKGIVVSYSLKMAKPDPKIYEHLLSKYHLVPAQTIFIDDHQKNVDGAEKCGIHGILFLSADDCRRKIQEINCKIS